MHLMSNFMWQASTANPRKTFLFSIILTICLATLFLRRVNHKKSRQLIFYVQIFLLGADHKKSMALQTETLKVGPNEFRGVSTVYILDTFSSCNIVHTLKKKKLDFLPSGEGALIGTKSTAFEAEELLRVA